MSSKWRMGRWMGVLLAGVLAWGGAQDVRAEESAHGFWYISPGLGWIDYEGDACVEDGMIGMLRLGYDYSDYWTFEAELSLAPNLDERLYGRTIVENGEAVGFEQVSRLDEANGFKGVHDAYAVGIGLDAMFHFTRWERLDPYLVGGVGMRQYSEDMEYGSSDFFVRLGGGVMYHFNDEWALRVDARVFEAGEAFDANSTMDVGFLYTMARAPVVYAADGGPLDSDGDGLVDSDEAVYKTDPLDPDTDKDGLKDGPEVHQHKTNPLEKDTDLDQLTDGQEVLTHHTDPLDRDTDDGGVTDGHEVIEDRTDPLNGKDDLFKIELYLNFDYDKAIIKGEYFDDLDVILNKMLKRFPQCTAKIEGHADKLANSKEDYNLKLSQRRAEAVMKYFIDKGIDAGRLSAKGYGYSVPKEPNDPKLGNPVNRRTDIYIRGVDRTELQAL